MRFIASTLAHIEPGPGRDKSRPYILIALRNLEISIMIGLDAIYRVPTF